MVRYMYTCTMAPCPQTMTTAYHGDRLREAIQALVRVQAHMLARRIVVEIRAADIAVELEP